MKEDNLFANVSSSATKRNKIKKFNKRKIKIMSKYQLIKIYPGSLELGYIVDFKEQTSMSPCEYIYYKKNEVFVIKNINITEFPEFWKNIDDEYYIFTTEDNIKLERNHSYVLYEVDKNLNVNRRFFDNINKDTFFDENFKYFLTEEKLNEYINNIKTNYESETKI